MSWDVVEARRPAVHGIQLLIKRKLFHITYSLLLITCSLIFPPYLLIQCLDFLLVRHKSRFARIGAALLHGHVALLAFPKADVWVIRTLGGLGIDVFGIFDEGAAVGAHIAELAILAHVNLVLVDEPQILESRLVDGLLQSGILDVAVVFGHSRTVLDVTVGINADFAVKTGVVALGFGEAFYVN